MLHYAYKLQLFYTHWLLSVSKHKTTFAVDILILQFAHQHAMQLVYTARD